MNIEDLQREREAIKARREELEALIAQPGIEEDERIAIHGRLAGISQELAGIDGRLAALTSAAAESSVKPKCVGGVINEDHRRGIVIDVTVLPPLSPNQFSGSQEERVPDELRVPLSNLIVDTGCNFPVILAKPVFDDLVRKLSLKVSSCEELVYGQDALKQRVVVDIVIPAFKKQKTIEVLRSNDNHISLFGLLGLELFRLGISATKEVFPLSHVYRCYPPMKLRRSDKSPLLQDHEESPDRPR